MLAILLMCVRVPPCVRACVCSLCALRMGSGQVVLQEQEPTLAQVQKQVNEQGVTHVVVSDSCDRTISKWLDSSKVPYFKGDYLMDFLAHKSKPSPNDSIYKPELVEKRSGFAGGSWPTAKSPARGRS